MTLSVCRLRFDTSTYQTLRLAEPEAFYARFPRPFAGLSMAKTEAHFAPIDCLINEPERPAADFTSLLPGMFVISQRVYDSRLYMRAMNLAAEVADLTVNGERRYAVNVVRIFNALDRSRAILSRTDDGHILAVERYAFRAERIGGESALFKLPETATGEILAWHRVSDTGDDEWCNFPAAYQQSGFTGLAFDLLAEEADKDG
jgi:hypothetical protein